jgi:tetratricopeptide (TPR) repeat protein
MYLRTPKRYRTGHRRSLVSPRRLLLWLIVPLLIFAGLRIYENRALYEPVVRQAIFNVVGEAQNSIATMTAPTPLPTQDPSERIARAHDAWKRGAIETAVQEYQSLLDVAPNDVTIHYRVTLGLLMDGQLEQALDAAERTVTANPYSSDAWAIRAMVLDWNGRPGEAIASALRALELDPNNARAMAFLAEAYYDSNQPERALEIVNEALELDPESFEAYRVRGYILQGAPQYDLEGARQDYQRAYDLAPHLPYLAIDLAAIDAALDNVEGAIETLEEALEQNPGNTNVLYLIGSFYYRDLGSPNQAADYLTRCIEANPDYVRCHYLLGRVQIALEQYAAAVQSLETAINLGTTDPYHYWWAGRAHVIQGECPAAIPYLQTGYELAKAAEDADLITTYEDSLRECGALASLPAEATEEATEEPADSGE